MKKGKGSMKKIYYLSDMLNFDLDHDPLCFAPPLFSLTGIRSLGSGTAEIDGDDDDEHYYEG